MTPPARKLTPATSNGFEAIDFAETILGVELLPWQRWLLIHALELNPGGDYRFRTVVLLVARQNGKSTLMQVLSLYRMFCDGAKQVIGTAQNLDLAEKLWLETVQMAENAPELAGQIASVSKVNGKKEFLLHTGESYKVAAASRRGGRGLSGDLVLLDELREHQSWDSWGAVTKTTIARARAQIWCPSNAGDAQSVVLRHLRAACLANPSTVGGDGDVSPLDRADDDETDDSMAIFEWSAAPNLPITDRKGWQQANPALGHTITERALSSAAGTDPEAIFRIEVLCQWVSTAVASIFPAGSWEACEDYGSKRDPNATVKPSLAIDVSHDRTTTHIAIAAKRADGLAHVEVVASRPGTDWVIGWLKERQGRYGPAVVQANGAPASFLLDELAEAGLPTLPWSGSALGRGSSLLLDSVRSGRLRHRGQPALDLAASLVRTKASGDGFLWDRRSSPCDIAPLVAATGALWGIGQQPTAVASAYETRGLLTVG